MFIFLYGGGLCSTCFPFANLPFHYCGWNRLFAEKNAPSLVLFICTNSAAKRGRGVEVVIKDIYVISRVPTISMS
jgi:hypothetical protein